MAAITATGFNDKHLDEGFGRIFGGFHSEASRQDLIHSKATAIQCDLIKSVIRNEDDAREVGANLIGFLDDEDGIAIARYVASGDREGLFKLFVREYGDSIARTAEVRAIHEVERGE